MNNIWSQQGGKKLGLTTVNKNLSSLNEFKVEDVFNAVHNLSSSKCLDFYGINPLGVNKTSKM